MTDVTFDRLTIQPAVPAPKLAARFTGLAYLGLAVTGMVGFLVVRPMLHDPASAAATLANLMEHRLLARVGVALELGIVLTQALVAMCFFRLFRAASPVAAASVAAFGLVNAVAILASATALHLALAAALNPAIAPGGDQAATVQLMFAAASASWTGGSVFFGLWLIPMGYAVVASGQMPKLLGQLLMVGGIGYVLSAFVKVLTPGVPEIVADLLTVPATAGEFWIIGYLLLVGVRPGVAAASHEKT